LANAFIWEEDNMNKMLEIIKLFFAFIDYAKKSGNGKYIGKEFVDF
jgi:hypothetical protein